MLFFNDTATTEIYTLSLHDALPISTEDGIRDESVTGVQTCALPIDRKSTRLNSSHTLISYIGRASCRERSEEHTSELQSTLLSYAVFCLKKQITLRRRNSQDHGIHKGAERERRRDVR